MRSLRRALWGLAVAGVVLGLVVLALMVTSDMIDTPGVWAAGTLLAGWGFIGVGLYAWGRRPDNRVGTLMAATGFAWLVAAAGFSDLPLVFTLSQVLGAVFFAVVIHLLLAFPSGRLQSLAERRIVVAAYLLTTVVNLPLWLFADPKALGCDDCPRNLILIDSKESVVTTASTTTAPTPLRSALAVVTTDSFESIRMRLRGQSSQPSASGSANSQSGRFTTVVSR